MLISVLVARADARARAAEARAEELRRQQDLSRLLVEPQPGPRPYEGVLRVVVATFGFLDGALYVQAGGPIAGSWSRPRWERSPGPCR